MTGDETGFEIAGRAIGPGHPPYVIAEMSSNHLGDLGRAREIIHAAKESGADAVKLQTQRPEHLTLDHDGADFVVQGGLWEGRRLHDLYQEVHTPWDWHAELFELASKLGIGIFSSPFDIGAVDFLDDLGCPAFKIASFEAVDLGLIRHASDRGKPLIVSTGMTTQGEIDDIVAAVGAETPLALLHCVSAYPAPPAEANLAVIPDMAARLGLPVGLSDHSPGTAVAVAAVALGACVVEKHFTLARADGGADAAFSMEPEEFTRLSADCRTAWEARGEVVYGVKPSEEGSVAFRRSLYVSADMKQGEAFSEATVKCVRPGHGLAPKHLDTVLGKRASRDLSRGEALDWSMVE